MDGIGGLMRERLGCLGSVQELRYSPFPLLHHARKFIPFGIQSVEKIYVGRILFTYIYIYKLSRN